jgi:hypothetical protein
MVNKTGEGEKGEVVKMMPVMMPMMLAVSFERRTAVCCAPV